MTLALSHRITGINGGGSDGWDVFYRARGLKTSGAPVIELTIGEHDIGTAPEILRAMHDAALGGHTGYAVVPGTDTLRETVAQRIAARTGVQTGPANIQITSGGQAALFAAHHAVCDDGDRALFIDPYYATYPGTIRSVGGVPVPVPARAENGFLPDPADILRAAEGGAKSLLINTPNNPTGVVYGQDTLEGIARACREADLWLISDEVYDTQVWDGDHLSPRALPGMADRTLVIGSMSKSHAMTGSRIGWICGPEAAIAHILDLSTNTNYGVPGYIQDAAEFALMQGAQVEQAVAAPFRRRRDMVLGLVGRQQLVRAIPAQGAMYVMLDIRGTGMDGESFANALLDQEMIAVMPGESFGAAAAGHIRVALTVEDDSLQDAVTRLLAFAARMAR